MDIVIGKLDVDMEEAILEAAPGIERGWIDALPDLATISLLNIASVTAFMDHVSRLEGRQTAADNPDSTYHHLPWWMSDVWLPVSLGTGGAPLTLGDVLLAEADGLLADLESIRTRTDLPLGTPPEGYDAMRRDIKAFYRSNFALDDRDAVIAWVWLALFESATLAKAHRAPAYLS